MLQESKADQGSPSMALFRWCLGKALLEAGEVGRVEGQKAAFFSRDERDADLLFRTVKTLHEHFSCCSVNVCWPAIVYCKRTLI